MSKYSRNRGSTSNMVRVFIQDNTATKGTGLTGLVFNSTNLQVAVIREFESAPTIYTGADIENITTIGTFQAPSTSSKIRFKAVDGTNMPGMYEIHFHDDAGHFAVGDGSKNLQVYVFEIGTTALNIAPSPLEIQLTAIDLEDDVRMGLTALPNAAVEAEGGLYTRGSGAGQINQQTNGQINSNVARWLNTAVTADTAGHPKVTIKDGSGQGELLTTSGKLDTVTGVTNDVGITQSGADKVWSTAARTLTSFGTLVQEIWDKATSALTTVGSIGKLLVDNINVTISSRSSHDAASIWAVGTRALTDKANFSLSTAGIKAIWDQLTSALTTVGSIGKLLVDNINATISSRSSHSAADVWTSGTRTLTSFGTLVSDIWSNATRTLTSFGSLVADIWDALTSGLTTVGSIGKLLVDNVNATISSRSSHAAADIWSVGTRTLTSFGTLIADIWSYATRTLTAGTKDTEIDAIKAKTDNLPSGIKKNTALNNFEFFMVDSTDHITGKTGLTITAERSIDGAAFAACANSASEVSGGIYKINLAASDLNGDIITLKFTAAGADARLITIITEP